ncbi:hypothetical protein F2P81_013270 [Scophthalmus maximus]|uniref:DDE Tnp4 domain-containing protein n=1 Tax=Scophthalmus maximus TaxID=52904 RepID=A0A6A4SZU3_SCOMX|nr:hypothetical protein F2P81_013270 [Scophthalmus maximus]
MHRVPFASSTQCVLAWNLSSFHPPHPGWSVLVCQRGYSYNPAVLVTLRYTGSHRTIQLNRLYGLFMKRHQCIVLGMVGFVVSSGLTLYDLSRSILKQLRQKSVGDIFYSQWTSAIWGPQVILEYTPTSFFRSAFACLDGGAAETTISSATANVNTQDGRQNVRPSCQHKCIDAKLTLSLSLIFTSIKAVRLEMHWCIRYINVSFPFRLDCALTKPFKDFESVTHSALVPLMGHIYRLLLPGTIQPTATTGSFTDVYIGWPGRTHDARVLSNSDLFITAEERQNGYLFPREKSKMLDGVEIPVHIIGDAASPLKQWLMKGFTQHLQLSQEQAHFTHTLSSARMAAENAFG